jgi:hypothetical protein
VYRRLELAGATLEAARALFPEPTIDRVHWHSRGIPRLINTVCENALITSFAQQLHNVSPGMVDDVAADFRLGVVPAHPEPAPKNSNGDNSEALEAVKTLLNLHDYLKRMRSNEPERASSR